MVASMKRPWFREGVTIDTSGSDDVTTGTRSSWVTARAPVRGVPRNDARPRRKTRVIRPIPGAVQPGRGSRWRERRVLEISHELPCSDDPPLLVEVILRVEEIATVEIVVVRTSQDPDLPFLQTDHDLL